MGQKRSFHGLTRCGYVRADHECVFYDGPDLPRPSRLRMCWRWKAISRSGCWGAFSDARLAAVGSHCRPTGETYGLIEQTAILALRCLNQIESSQLARLDQLRGFWRSIPRPQGSRLSGTVRECGHGVERWRAIAAELRRPPWKQQWRAPLRQAFDWLRDTVTPRYEAEGRKCSTNVRVRDAYVEVVLDRSRRNVVVS